MKKWIFILAVGLIWSQPGLAEEVGANDSFGVNDFNVSLPETDISVDDVDTSSSPEKSWNLDGFFQLDGGYSFNRLKGDPKLSKLKTTLSLTFDYKINADWKRLL